MQHRALASFTLVVVLAGCPGPAEPATDSGAIDGGGGGCAVDRDCDDDLFCTGAETCAPGTTGADARGCVAGSMPCPTAAACNEASDACAGPCEVPDADGDGSRAIACGGADCDDADPERAPGRTEVCDAANHDEDCDPRTYGFRDADGDGSPDATCCNDDPGGLRCGDDCDDMRPTVHPGLAEVCDERDNDCNESIDEGVLVTFFVDEDGDGYGSEDPTAPTMVDCVRPTGYSDRNDDCDDHAPAPPGDPAGGGGVHPGAIEVCDGADNDCNGATDEVPTGCSCTVGTAPRPCTLRGVCAAGTESCVGGRWEPCSIQPVAEVCDGTRDEDCDGSVDEEVRIPCYRDVDDDGYATLGATSSPTCRVATPDRVVSPYGGCPVGYTALDPTARADADYDDALPGRHAFASCYADCDGDSWGDGAVQYVCAEAGGACPTTGSGCGRLVGRAGDCCPFAAVVHPMQSDWYATYEVSCAPLSGWDYDCSGAREYEVGLATDCVSDGAGGCSGGTPGWIASTLPACGSTANYLMYCEAYWDFDRWDCRSVFDSRTVRCR